LQVGSTTASGLTGQIVATTTKNININTGYSFSAGTANGSTTNIDSTTWNFTNWPLEDDGGTFYREYTYDLTTKDTAGSTVASTTIRFTDLKNVTVFTATTSAVGVLPQQVFTYATFSSSTQSTEQKVGPFNFTAIKYGFGVVDLQKDFSAKTTETLTLSTDTFITETDLDLALASTGIIVTESTDIAYGEDSTSTAGWTTATTTAYAPIDQSKFFGIFGYDGTTADVKLVKDASGANGFTINYQTGAITFNTSQFLRTVNLVYSYGGRITVATTTNTSEIYDFTHAKDTNIFRTFDGTTYTSYLDVLIGPEVATGAIEEVNTRNVNFNAGYGWSAGQTNGSIKNIDATTFTFIWPTTATTSPVSTTTGTFSRQYTHDVTVQDKAGTAVSAASVKLTNFNDASVYDVETNGSGVIPQQTFTFATYGSTTESTEQKVGPFNFTAFKYAFAVVSLSKDLNSKTTETITLADDSFKVLSEADALLLQGIDLTTSTAVAFGAEATSTISVVNTSSPLAWV